MRIVVRIQAHGLAALPHLVGGVLRGGVRILSGCVDGGGIFRGISVGPPTPTPLRRLCVKPAKPLVAAGWRRQEQEEPPSLWQGHTSLALSAGMEDGR